MNSKMINLKPFCGKEETRAYLNEPFSRDSFTYATDGRICVRVERREDVAEQADYALPDVLQLPWAKGTDFRPLALKLPAKALDTAEPCTSCFDGYEHDCPDCECICEECDGSGEIKKDGDTKKSVGILGVPVALAYARLLTALPGLAVATTDFNALEFKFDGGAGFLMSLREPYENHFEVTA